MELMKFATVTCKWREVSLVARDLPNSSGSGYVPRALASTVKKVKTKIGSFNVFQYRIQIVKNKEPSNRFINQFNEYLKGILIQSMKLNKNLFKTILLGIINTAIFSRVY